MRYQEFDHKLFEILSSVSLVEKVLIFIFGYLLISANKAVAIPKSPSAKFIAQTPHYPKIFPKPLLLVGSRLLATMLFPKQK